MLNIRYLRQFLFSVLFLFALFGFGHAFAQTSGLASLSPPTTNKPVQVKLGLYIDDLDKVNFSTDTVGITGTLFVTWKDPRLSYRLASNAKIRSYVGDRAKQKIDSIWRPYVRFADVRAHRNVQSRLLQIFPDGQVVYVEKFNADFYTVINVHKFPFDSHKITILLRSFLYDSQQVSLSSWQKHTGISAYASAPGWNVGKNYIVNVKSKNLGWFSRNFSVFQYTFGFQRVYMIYLLKVLLPLLIFGILASALLWVKLPRDSLTKGVDYSITLLLVTIAFQWVVFSQLPNASYITLIDWLILFSFIYVCMVILVLVMAVILSENSRRIWIRIQSLAKYILPCVYVVGVLAIFSMLLF